MFILKSKIEVGKYVFTQIHEGSITKDIETIEQTATIKLPTHFYLKNTKTKLLTETAIKTGDYVRITLGYDGIYSGIEFEGYVKKIKLKTQVEIECENAIYVLRRLTLNKEYNAIDLQDLVKDILVNTNIKLHADCIKMPLDKWLLKDANGAQALEGIKKELLQTVYFTSNNVLYVGLQQMLNIGKTAVYDLNYNLTANNLEWASKADRKIKVKYNYLASDGKKHFEEAGDSDGESREFYTSVVKEPTKLKQMATEEVDKLKYDGFSGSLSSFLAPYAEPCMEAKIIDKDKPHRNGYYFIKKVETTFGTSGARRTVSIGNKL